MNLEWIFIMTPGRVQKLFSKASPYFFYICTERVQLRRGRIQCRSITLRAFRAFSWKTFTRWIFCISNWRHPVWMSQQCECACSVNCISNVNVSIGLASATSQLDWNAWQRVATYKSGSKQTWRLNKLGVVRYDSYLLCMEPHQESTDGSNTRPASTLLSSYSQVFLVFFLQVQIPCYILISCATSQVRRAVSLSVVPVQHCCLEEDLSRPTISFPWAVLCVVDSLSLILVGHSKGKTHETMKRRQVHHTSTSNDAAALFVDEYPRPSIDVCTIGNSLTLRTNLAEPPLSVQLWVNKLSKICQYFLNLLVKEKQLWQVNVLSPSMPLYGTLSLFRTSSAGCYAFPCVSLGSDVSTCKPYSVSAAAVWMCQQCECGSSVNAAAVWMRQQCDCGSSVNLSAVWMQQQCECVDSVNAAAVWLCIGTYTNK